MSWRHSTDTQEAAAQARGRWPIIAANGIVPAALLSDASVTPFAVRVYAAISWMTNDYNGGHAGKACTLVRIAAFLHASTDGVYQAVKNLKRSGWITATRVGRRSRYRLHSSPDSN